MELTRERIEIYANAEWTKPEIRSMAKQLLAEMDKPSVWTNAPDNAIIAKVHFYIADKVYARANGIPEVYTRKTPKSRIDELAEEAREKLRDYLFAKDGQESSVVDDIIKSAILKDREEREANR